MTIEKVNQVDPRVPSTKARIIVPTPSYGGEELYTQMGFFLFSEFSPIDIFIVETYEWYH